jgi:hypothetical protein
MFETSTGNTAVTKTVPQWNCRRLWWISALETFWVLIRPTADWLPHSEDGVCNARPDGIPIARYRAGSSWTRAYQIVDASGVAEPTTWVRGQGFTFAKNASSNALVNDKIVKSSTAAHIVFKAVNDSGPTATAYAEVEFSA